MREQLIRYVDLLFAGAEDAADIKQEILQNTLDRYDDLIQQGKSPEAAYRLAISGIGDINEILGSEPESSSAKPQPEQDNKHSASPRSKRLRVLAIFLYITCPIPLFILGDTIGLCGLLIMVALATAMIVLAGKDTPQAQKPEEPEESEQNTPQQELRRSVCTLIWAIGLVIYFVLSFTTGAWYITWVIFPMIGAAQGLARAVMDYREAAHHEN